MLLDPALGAAGCVAAHTFMRSPLHSLYLSTAFTRTATVRLSSQHTALCIVAFAKALEQVLRRRGGELLAEPRLTRQPSSFQLSSCTEDIRIALAILHTLRTLGHGRAYGSRDGGGIDGGASVLQEPVHLSRRMAAKLLGPNPAAHFTEAEGDSVDTVCQLLALMCLSPELEPLFEASRAAQLSTVAFGLLAEAVSRSCRVLLRTSPPAPASMEACSGQGPTMLLARHLARRALGIRGESCHDARPDDEPEPPSTEHSSSYALDSALRASGNFFLKALTNATPFAVVACIGVASFIRSWCKKHHSKYESLETVLADSEASVALATVLAAAFESKEIGMRAFIETHLPGASAQHVQAALYVQGLLFHDAKARRAGLPPLSQPEALLAELARNERKEIYLAHLQQKTARLSAAVAASKRGARRQLQLAAKTEFMAVHAGTPRLFSHADVATLNETRPADDQLKLAHGSPGLLLHHCCYPGCPMFLRDCRLPADRALSAAAGRDSGVRANKGLWRHLKYFVMPERTYFSACHATALSILTRQPKMGQDQFIKVMSSQLQLHAPRFSKDNGFSVAEVEAILADIYQQFRAKAAQAK